MKHAVRPSVLTLAALGVLSPFFAFAQVGDRWELPAPPSLSALTRAEVQAQAVQAAQERLSRGYINESGLYARLVPSEPLLRAHDRGERDAQNALLEPVSDPLFTRG